MPCRWRPTRTLAQASRLGSLGLLGVLVVVAVTLQPAGPLLAVGTLDQSQTTQGAGSLLVGPDAAMAQTFTASLTGDLDQVALALTTQGAGTVTIEIRDAVGGAPGSTVLASATVPVASLPARSPVPSPLTSIPLGPPAPVVAGTQYAIVVSRLGSGVSPLGIVEATGASDPYPPGEAFFHFSGGDGFAPLPDFDLVFQTFVTQAVLSVGSITRARRSDHEISRAISRRDVPAPEEARIPVLVGYPVQADS
jgi:hypothetical protein